MVAVFIILFFLLLYFPLRENRTTIFSDVRGVIGALLFTDAATMARNDEFAESI